jgi:Spy/CpxP family protein refolding chaperone
MSKAAKIFFTLSILINVALGGVILGHIYKQFKESDFGQIRGDVSPETRQIMRQVYKDKHKEIRAMRVDMREKKDDLKKVIGADEFDEDKFEDAAEKLKKQNEKAFDSRVDTFAKVLSKLKADERKKMASMTADILAGHRKWDKSKHPPPPPGGPNPHEHAGPPGSPEEAAGMPADGQRPPRLFETGDDKDGDKDDDKKGD